MRISRYFLLLLTTIQCFIVAILAVAPFAWVRAQSAAVPVSTATSTTSSTTAPTGQPPTPRPPTSVEPANQIPTAPTPVSTETHVPILNVATVKSSSDNTLLYAAIAGAAVLGLGGFAASQFRKKKNGNKKKEQTGENEEDRRCFDIKKLMEEKWNELTDLRSKLKSKIEERARDEVRKKMDGTPAADVMALLEQAEKEYARLKQLYEKCVIEFEGTKRVFIVHGWGGNPEESWFPWLKKELEAKGFEVFVPELPNPAHPRIDAWVTKLAEVVSTPDEKTYLVGHSMGCQTIARYLERLSDGQKIGGAVFVAGFFKRLTNLEDTVDERETEKHWMDTPLDFGKVASHLPKSVAIFSDNDPWVPLDNQDDFRDKLGSEIIVEHKKGHFSGGDDQIFELPIVLEKIVDISK